MSKGPRILHRDHHLSVRQALWSTYIVCDECETEYQTAWNIMLNRGLFPCHAILWLILFLFVGTPSNPALYITFYIASLCILRIGLNALQAFLLRRSDDLASHIF